MVSRPEKKTDISDNCKNDDDNNHMYRNYFFPISSNFFWKQSTLDCEQTQ